jgi:isopentenyldiphosphate isomerase
VSAEQVILVDEKDISIGEMSKEEVHKVGLLHRAYSLFISTKGGSCCCRSGH